MRVSINVVLFCALALCATAKLPASSKLQSFRVQREEAENAVPTVTAATAVKGLSGGTATVSSLIFNLAKTILGAGVLSLPSGVASFSDSESALLPSSAILLVMGALSAYSFSSIGKACKTHDVTSFAAAWTASTGHVKSASLVTGLITFKTFFACLAYSIIIGDSFSQIFKSVGFADVVSDRTNVVVGLTSLVLFPLCLLKNLDALKYTSILGLAGLVYTAAFMGFRLFDGSYASGGKFFSAIDASLRPSFGVKDFGGKEYCVFLFMSMMATAFMAHYNAPKFMAELKEPTMENYNKVVKASFGFSAAAYMLVMWIGFKTFGGSATGFVLNNYASTDKLATIARIAIGAGVLFGYPLTFSALRDGVFDLSGLDRSKLFIPVTVALMAVLTQGALVMRNVGTVLSFSGALIGSLIIFIIPSIMNICNIRKEITAAAASNNKGKEVSVNSSKSGQQVEIMANYAIIAFGALVAVIGVGANVVASRAGAESSGH